MKFVKIAVAVLLFIAFIAVLFVGMSAITWEFGQWASNYVREVIALVRQLLR
jgi:hypothetical protein